MQSVKSHYLEPLKPPMSASSKRTHESIQAPLEKTHEGSKANYAARAAEFAAPKFSHPVQSVLLTAQENSTKESTAAKLDHLFANDPVRPAGPVELGNIPELLLPSAQNVAAISKHASARFSEMLKQYGIPEAPETITFNQEGKMRLPENYPFKDELNAALDENPGLVRELSTLNALASHVAEFQKREPMYEEIQSAESQADVNRIIEKYLHFFLGDGDYSDISLAFSKNGSITPTADGQAVRLN